MIDARDGRYDSIDCGAGTDTLLRRPGDFADNCEIAPDRDGDGTLNEAGLRAGQRGDQPRGGGDHRQRGRRGLQGRPAVRAGRLAGLLQHQAPGEPQPERFTKLTVGEIKPGDKIEIRCSTKARGCPFTKKTVTGKSKRTSACSASSSRAVCARAP